jgi:kynurenine formamidase
MLCLCFIGSLLVGSLGAQEPGASPLPNLFDNVRFVDLSYSLNDTNQYWPGENYSGFEMKTIATLEKDGVLSKTLSFPEHLGTHLDAPNHFEPNQPSVAELTPEQLFGPGVVIDMSLKAEMDADAMLFVEEIEAWETEHGRIPNGAIVLLNTGWGKFWNNTIRYQNRDARGQLHFPSYSAEAARFLIEQRKVRGIGVDNLSIDRGISKEFKVHHIVNGAGKFGLENVAHLDKLPPRGFQLLVAPIKVEDGTGGPARVWAVLPRDGEME